jgi:hypothetical protein
LAALPDEVDAAAAGDELPFEAEELSFADDELSLDEEPEDAVSDAVADLRLSVR